MTLDGNLKKDLEELINSQEEKEKIEQSLRNNEAKQSALISNISDVIAIVDATGIIRYKSPNIEKYFGWKPEDLIEKEAWTTVHPNDLKFVQGEFIKLLQKENAETRIEYNYICNA